MSGSVAKSVRILGGLIGGLALTGAITIAAAQQGPVRLIPGARSSQEPSAIVPVPATPDRSALPQTQLSPGEIPVGTPVPSQGNVEVQSLPAPDFSGAGLLSEREGGFSPELWQGSQREVTQPLLLQLEPSTSPAIQSLGRRLLLSAGAPEGAFNGVSFLFARIERLATLGFTKDALNLSRTMPAQQRDRNFEALMAQINLFTGKTEEACAAAPSLVAQLEDPIWTKAVTFCRAVAGDQAGAEISAGLLREQQVRDPAFFTLLSSLGGDGGKIEGFDSRSPLHVAMLIAAKRPLEGQFIEKASPMAAAAMALHEVEPVNLVLVAAERAFILGSLTGEELAKLYQAVIFPPTEFDNIEKSAESYKDSRTDALLFQAVLKADSPKQQAELINLAIQFWTSRKLPLVNAGILYAPLVQDIVPEAELAWFAPNAIRILLAAGDLRAAQAWQQTLPTPDRTTALRAMSPVTALLQLADVDVPPPTDTWLEDWYEAQPQSPAELRDQRATLLVVLLDALGYQVPRELWQRLYTSSGTVDKSQVQPPSPVLLRGLERASDAGHLGDTILFSLLILQAGGPEHTDAATLAVVVKSLRKIGLVEDAERLAIEAALARGF